MYLFDMKCYLLSDNKWNVLERRGNKVIYRSLSKIFNGEVKKIP